MPFCPSCGAAYRDGVSECKSCSLPLGPTPPEALEPARVFGPAGEVQWTVIYEGLGIRARSLEEGMRMLDIPAVRLPGKQEVYGKLPPHVGQDLHSYRIAIPEEQYRARQADVDALVAALNAEVEHPDAMQEAEEDYDVRACPECVLYFHENNSTCPGCGTELVPAVECFEEGQTEPDRVIVGHGSEALVKNLASSLQAQGFDAQAFEVEGWSVDVVDLPWGELIDRTAEVESILGIRSG